MSRRRCAQRRMTSESEIIVPPAPIIDEKPWKEDEKRIEVGLDYLLPIIRGASNGCRIRVLEAGDASFFFPSMSLPTYDDIWGFPSILYSHHLTASST